MSAADDAAGRLFDFAATRPDGFTRHEVCAALNLSCSVYKRAVQRLRLVLADDDSINLIANRSPEQGGQWLYQLVGTPNDALWWSNNRRRDSETRLRTIAAVNRSMIAATDSHTDEGRYVRVIDKGLRRLIEDLNEMNAAS